MQKKQGSKKKVRLRTAGACMTNDLHTYVSLLLEQGKISVVEREVDPKFELAAVISQAEKRSDRAVLFRHVKGSQFPVVANIYGSFSRVGQFVGATEAGLNVRWNEMLDALPGHSDTNEYMREVPVPAGLTYGKLSDLPHITYREKDAAPYITAGVFLAHDPDTSVPNLSFARCMLLGDDTQMYCCIDAPHDLADYQARAEARGEALEVAILIGAPTSVFLAAVTSLPIDRDELHLAALIGGGSIDMRTCQHLGFRVPAATEIVIEAKIRPGVRAEDGPFGEYLGYYSGVNKGAYALDVLGVSWRENAYFQGLLCGSSEDLTLLAVAWGARIYRGLVAKLPGILDVTISAAPSASIVKIEKQYEGHPRDVMDAVFRLNPHYHRMCIVVDRDIDIHDLQTVWWSFLTRGSLDKRVYRLSGLEGVADSNYEYTGYLGIDATGSLSFPLERASTPGADELKLEDYITN